MPLYSTFLVFVMPTLVYVPLPYPALLFFILLLFRSPYRILLPHYPTDIIPLPLFTLYCCTIAPLFCCVFALYSWFFTVELAVLPLRHHAGDFDLLLPTFVETLFTARYIPLHFTDLCVCSLRTVVTLVALPRTSP